MKINMLRYFVGPSYKQGLPITGSVHPLRTSQHIVMPRAGGVGVGGGEANGTITILIIRVTPVDLHIA